MENQPPIRPWFRSASIARLEAAQGQTTAPAPAPPPPRPPIQAPVPRIPLARGLTMRAQPPPPQPPTLQQETPPPPPPEAPTRSLGNGAAPVSQQPPRPQASPPPPSPRVRTPPRDPTPPESPRVIKSSSSPPPPSPRLRIPPRDPTPPESPRAIKSSSSTPAESPRKWTFLPFQAQPSPNPEPEQKSVMESQPKSTLTRQESSSNSVKAINKESSSKWSKPAANGTSATSRKKEDGGAWKIVTLAGENTGAYMEMGSSHHGQKLQKEKQQNGQQQNHKGLEIESGSEDGRSSDKKGGKQERKPVAAVVNNNVQSVNNSLLFNSKCKQKSPGVHLALASHRQPKLSKGSDPSFAKRNSQFQ
ncbi:putative basic proline-rich protein-like [Iris pallida]|uniref:Basic proline-rich protein-like n=1 Tax=Iris pallida TaxID=29817 RepID=A0AAX6I0I0_IRIPA|nr:putative basic proline-rich protein-like [Iris pallida]